LDRVGATLERLEQTDVFIARGQVRAQQLESLSGRGDEKAKPNPAYEWLLDNIYDLLKIFRGYRQVLLEDIGRSRP